MLVQSHPLVEHSGAHDRRELRILARQDRPEIDEIDLRSEPTERLRELAADRPGAEDQKTPRQLREAEDRFVREIGQGLQTRQRRHRRATARRNYEPARLDQMGARFEPVWSDEAGVLTQNRDAKALEPLGAVMGRDTVNDPAHVPAHCREIDPRLADTDPEALRGPRRMCGRRSGDQALGRYAARVQAVPAHGTAFDQHHVGTQLRGPRGHAQPCGAGPDDAEIRRPLLAHRVPWATPRTVGTVSSRRSCQLNLAALTSA